MEAWFQDEQTTLFQGDSLEILRLLPSCSVQCVVTSPPYWALRDYGVEGQLGLEPTPEQYIENMVEVFREVRRVLRDEGTLWLNIGDSYAGSGMGMSVPPKRLRLRANLTPEQTAYVLEELAKHSRMASATVEGDA